MTSPLLTLHPAPARNTMRCGCPATVARAAVAALLVTLLPLPARAQQMPAPPPITLDDAIRLAEAKNEQVAAAEAGVQRAQADELRARSQQLPQVAASASYDRTLATEFSREFSAPSLPAGCSPYSANANAPIGERVGAIEQAINCGTVLSGLFSGFNALPFGRENIYRVNLSFSQNLFSGGRIGAQRSLALSGRRLADISLASARAQLVLDVTQAYFDAALSDRLAAIAEGALKQAEATAAQVELGWKAGRQPEFELLRARVARDNQRPLVIRAQSQRTLAYLRLAQLLNVPRPSDLRVAANLDDPVLPIPDRFTGPLASVLSEKDRENVDGRVVVRQAAESVNARIAATNVAKAERLPAVSFNSAYGRVAYPSSLPSFGDFLTNWTVGVVAQVPLFTGGRLRGDRMAAEADLVESHARLDQARKLARLDAWTAYQDLSAAEATWQASAGTVEQATRAYEIAELRYREGVSTQLELSDARLLLEQAQANRAQAARDLQVARAHVALLPDLPLSAGPLPSSLSGAGGAQAAGATQGGSGGFAAPAAGATTVPQTGGSAITGATGGQAQRVGGVGGVS